MTAAGLVRYNAERCEAAIGPTCHCSCGGEFHGKRHSEEWIKATSDLIDSEMEAVRKARDAQCQLPFEEARQ